MWHPLAWGQVNRGELRFSVADPSGAGLRARIQLDSQASHFHQSLETDATGHVTLALLPFGTYSLTVERSGFAAYHSIIDLHTTIPQDRRVQLAIAGVETQIRVNDVDTSVDLHSASNASQIGTQQIDQRLSSLPGPLSAGPRGLTARLDL